MKPEKKKIPTHSEDTWKIIISRSGYNQACTEWEKWLPSEEELGNLINKFTWEHRKGKEGMYALSHNEGFKLAQAISKRIRGEQSS